MFASDRLATTNNFIEHAHEIATEDFLHIGLRVAALEKRARDRRHLRYILHAFGKTRHAVEIGTKTDMIDTCDLDDMLDVFDEPRKRRLGNRLVDIFVQSPERVFAPYWIEQEFFSYRGQPRLELVGLRLGGITKLLIE